MRPYRLWVLAAVIGIVGCSETRTGLEEMDAGILEQLGTGTAIPEEKAEAAPVKSADGFKSAVKTAVERNAGYRSALSFEKEAAALIGVADSALRPQVSGNSTFGAIYEGDPILDTTLGVAAGVTLSQLLYDGGGTEGAITRATAEAVAARAARLDQGNQIALEAAQAWIDVWECQARQSWLSTKISNMNELISQIERMASNGMLDRASLDSARRQILDIELQRVTLKAETADAQTRFYRFFGRNITRPGEPEQIFGPASARANAQSWKTAPRLRSSAAELAAARGAESEAAAALKPKVSLQAGALSPLDTEDSANVTAGLRIDYTFGDGGRRKAALEAARARVVALEDKLRDDWQTAEAEMEAALDKLAALEVSMPLVAQKIDLSASEAKTARSQIATGQSNLRQLVEAEIENYRARDQHIQMIAEQRLLLLQIAAGAGLLTGLLGLEDV